MGAVRSLVRKQVIRTIEKWWRAWAAGDLATIEALCAEPYACFSNWGELRIHGTKALMEEARKFALVCPELRWSVQDPSIERLADALICTYWLVIADSTRGVPRVCREPMKDLLVEEARGWLIVAHHGNLWNLCGAEWGDRTGASPESNRALREARNVIDFRSRSLTGGRCVPTQGDSGLEA